MKKNNSTVKSLLIAFFCTLLLTTATIASQNVSFINYDSSNGYKSTYINNPLDCNYENDFEQKLNGYGKKWAMKSAIKSHGLDYNGEYVLNGYSKLTSKSWVTGFTGATFIFVKDTNGQEMYLASVKTMNPIATVNVGSDQAEEVSWGVNPGKLKLYVAGYKYKKVLWWKVKLPIIKSKVKAKNRTINWSIKLPKYIIDRDITIELVNVHTPTHRVIAALKDSGQKVASFVLANGIQTKELYEKAQNKELTYADVENYINGVLAWAETQQLIDPAKSLNVTNIMTAIHQMINNSVGGLQPENHDALVAIAFNLTSIISDKTVNPQALRSLINQIETVCQDKSGFVPANLQSVEDILVNLKGLIGDHLSDKQEQVYDNIVGVIATINDWNQIALSEHQSVIFDGMRLIVDLYEKIHNKTITVTQAEAMISTWLDEVGVVVYAEMPQHTAAFNNFRSVVLANMFKLLSAMEASSWL
jgi:hypothetical protein